MKLAVASGQRVKHALVHDRFKALITIELDLVLSGSLKPVMRLRISSAFVLHTPRGVVVPAKPVLLSEWQALP